MQEGDNQNPVLLFFSYCLHLVSPLSRDFFFSEKTLYYLFEGREKEKFND